MFEEESSEKDFSISERIRTEVGYSSISDFIANLNNNNNSTSAEKRFYAVRKVHDGKMALLEVDDIYHRIESNGDVANNGGSNSSIGICKVRRLCIHRSVQSDDGDDAVADECGIATSEEFVKPAKNRPKISFNLNNIASMTESAVDGNPSPDCSTKRFLCQLCDFSTNKPALFTAHYNQSHSGRQKRYSCLPCNVRFNDVPALKKHVTDVHETDSGGYVCKPCDKTYENSTKFYRHCRYFHAAKRYVCDQCDKSFKRIDKLKLHKKCHDKTSRDFMCLRCLLTFRRSDKLKEHENRCHREELNNFVRNVVHENPKVSKKKKTNFQSSPVSTSTIVPDSSVTTSNDSRSETPLVSHTVTDFNESHRPEDSNVSGLGIFIEPMSNEPCFPSLDGQVTEMSQEEFDSLLASNSYSVVFDGKETVYTCHLCFATFKRHGMFTTHMHNHHPDVELPPLNDEYMPRKTRTAYRCPFCRSTLPNMKRLKNHARRYHKNFVLDTKRDNLTVTIPLESVPAKCRFCHCSYLNKWKLKEHVRKKHSDSQHPDSRKRLEFWRKTLDCDGETSLGENSIFEDMDRFGDTNLDVDQLITGPIRLLVEPDDAADAELQHHVRPSSTPAVVDNDQYYFPLAPPTDSDGVPFPSGASFTTIVNNVSGNTCLLMTSSLAQQATTFRSDGGSSSAFGGNAILSTSFGSLFDDESNESVQRPCTPVTPLPVAMNNNTKLLTPKVVRSNKLQTPEHSYISRSPLFH